ncbi:hypothetical protein D9Q98_004235 [Chlorella vulgaris]|uniref:Uncharacterized protein n=1 Tax=Chlorella vulgaris TaxID=3077 RepID=A0A9D4TSU2_CHLVU|nr:hypothetical protein D9Q98_004235 [Chlorella vulgaris]
MEVAGTSQVAGAPVPGGPSFTRVPSSVGTDVSWDEMGQLGLHKALNEYYKLSGSNRNLRMCGMRKGAPPLLCLLCEAAHRVLVPQLPAVLAPPALLAGARRLLMAAAWLLYCTAAFTVPLALWLLGAAEGRLALAPQAVAAADRLHPAAGAAAQRLQGLLAALPHPSRAAAAAGLAVLLVLLSIADRTVASARQEEWERRRRRVTAASVEACYDGWLLPGGRRAGAAAAVGDTAAAAAAAAAAGAQRQQQLLGLLRLEVGRVWHSVFDAQLPPEHMRSVAGISAAVSKLCTETGIALPEGVANGGGGSNGDAASLLLATVQLIKRDVGVS